MRINLPHSAIEILLAEDSPTQALQLEHMLLQHGYKVSTYANGSLALAAARQRKPTLIISDIVMPEMNGYELCRRVKADPVLADVPVFLVTTLADPVDVIRGLECRADNFILKPYDQHYLLNRIQFVLLNKAVHQSERTSMGVEINFNGQKHFIESSRLQILNLLLSTYDAAIQRNNELEQAHEEMRQINRSLADANRKLEQENLERRQIQESLHESEQRNRTILHAALDGVFTIDEQGKIVDWNPQAEHIFGYASAEVLGQRLAPFIVPERLRSVHQRTRDHFLQTGEGPGLGKRVETIGVRADGTEFPVEYSTVPIRSGNSYIFTSFVRDITESKLAQEALVSKEEEIRAIVEGLVDCVMTIDADGTVQSANSALERLLGISAMEVIGKNIGMVIPGVQRGAQALALTHAHTQGLTAAEAALVTSADAEIEARHQDGHLIPCELTVGAYRVRGKELYACTLHDISERRRYMAELTKASADAKLATQAKSDFLAAMSHEIRTPMNGVVGMIDVLARSSLKPHQTAMVDLIRDSAFSLLTIIDDILDFSKIEAGRIEIENEPVAVAGVVEKVCVMLNRLAEKQNVELTLFTDPTIPEDLVGDALRLRQVLINLINNAIKFSGGTRKVGKVAVRALLIERDANQAQIEFQVIDNGIGMNEATLATLFSAFTQADASTTRRFGGTGLGLAISHNLVTLMGGSITVQSAQGQGSTFTLRMPFALPATATTASSQSPSLVEGLSCLIIGNGETLSGDMATYLSNAKAQTQMVADLEAAIVLTPNMAAGIWVWIINAGTQEPPSLEQLRTAARTNAQIDARFVLIGRGPCRYPHHIDADRVTVDGNVLTRSALLRAVAIAAERVQEDAYDTAQEIQALTHSAPRLIAPSREEARRQGRLILVAEDNDINQKVIMQQFALLGLTADLTGDGVQALLRWQSGDYALILTDLHMPGMDGYQLAAAVRAEEAAGQHIPIIALTANALKSESVRCREAGMDDYMSKPAPLAGLQAMLEKWLPIAVEKSATPANGLSLPSEAPLDVDVLRGLVGDDPQVIAEFLRDFHASALRNARDIHQACAADDGAGAAAAAHKLKSAARSVGAMALGELCARIEAAGKARDLDPLAAAHAQFKRELATLDVYLAGLNAREAREGT